MFIDSWHQFQGATSRAEKWSQRRRAINCSSSKCHKGVAPQGSQSAQTTMLKRTTLQPGTETALHLTESNDSSNDKPLCKPSFTAIFLNVSSDMVLMQLLSCRRLREWNYKRNLSLRDANSVALKMSASCSWLVILPQRFRKEYFNYNWTDCYKIRIFH